ncbi:outer membrane protein assembly factor BamB family protein [Zavarzinella formosa]|uniref:outer membrane protein assembly factor BamB family protein n=1 Tax=Zavarzinella formosa TaxID=360055 RepID=UPI0002DECE2A|nr:PQQ-binding-like beta-propeller repeat protein [Zavarzinella formosa]
MRSLFTLALGCLLFSPAIAPAKITKPVTLEQVVKEQPLILTVKVGEWLPDKPGMVLVPVEVLKGKFAFERIPVALAGDKEANDEKQVPKLLERLDKDVTLLIFATQRGKVFDAIGYVNGTWLHFAGNVEQQDGKDVTRWRFTHAETYFTRTFKGTTEELLKAVQEGLKGNKLPAYDETAEPGFGPPLKKKQSSAKSGYTPLGVIQLPFIGLIVALAALFPTVFGGLALMMKRWVAALSVGSFVTILTALYLYFPHWIRWSGLTTFSRVWFACAGMAGIGAMWSIRRYRLATKENRTEEFQPRYLDRVGLAAVLGLIAVMVLSAVAFKWSLRESPFLESILLAVPATACLGTILLAWFRKETTPVAVSTETIGLWAGGFACAMAGMFFLSTSGYQVPTNYGKAEVKLQEEALWVFQPAEGGEVVSSPLVVGDRVYVAVHHRQGFTQYGRIYALERDTGKQIWEFDDEGAMKPIFCSPTSDGDALFIGEGYHTDRDSKLYCIDLETGKKRWEFKTDSHTESTPATDGKRVVFGAGDDGVYCLDAKTGEKLWQFTGENGLHVDANVLLAGDRVYAGSGTSQRRNTNRIFCLDVKTGNEIWGENIEYSCWGSPNIGARNVFFATGNGTLSVDRDPKVGVVLCRDAATGAAVWQRALPNSLVCQPALDRYQVYVGSRDGKLYALDRRTGEEIWSRDLGSPVLASPVVVADPKTKVAEVIYAQNHEGLLMAVSPLNGQPFWSLDFRSLTQQPYADTVTIPAVLREENDGKRSRRLFVGLGYGLSASASPTARLYCLRDTSE